MDEVFPRDGDLFEQELGKRLRSTESPFTWMPDRAACSAVSPDHVLQTNIPKEHNNNFLKYAKFMRRVYEMGMRGDDAAFEAVDEWEDFFINNELCDPFFRKNHLALKHVLYSSRAYLLLKMHRINQVEHLIGEIESMDLEGNCLTAAINGLRAKFFDRYGSEGHRKALAFAQKAMELDPEEPEWIYLTAKTMRDIRRGVLYNMEGTEDSRNEEFRLFEKLLYIEKKPVYLIRYGNACNDIASYYIYKHNKEDTGHSTNGSTFNTCKNNHQCRKCREIKDYINKGVECFKEAVAIEDPKRKTYLRVIRGLNNISRRYNRRFKDIGDIWAEKIFDSNLQGEIDREVFYAVGKYYQHLGKDQQKFKENIRKAAELGSLNAKKDLIRLRFEENGDSYNPEEEILEVMNVYPDRPKKLDCLTQLASYYLYIKHDLSKAVDFILEEKKEDPMMDSLYLREHKSWFYNDKKRSHVDLLGELIKKVSLRLRMLSNEDGTDEFVKLTNFKRDVREIVPQLFA